MLAIEDEAASSETGGTIYNIRWFNFIGTSTLKAKGPSRAAVGSSGSIAERLRISEGLNQFPTPQLMRCLPRRKKTVSSICVSTKSSSRLKVGEVYSSLVDK